MKIVSSLIIAISIIKLSDTTELTKKVVSIANNAFKKYHLTSVVWKGCDIQIISDFLKLYGGTVVTVELNADFDLIDTNVRYKQTVFFATDPTEFEYFMKIINRVIITPIKVILVVADRELSTYVSNEFTKIAWENDVGDILIVGYDGKDTIVLKTFFPYKNEICNDYTSVSLHPNTTNYFEEKFRNFNKCPIRVTLLENIPFVALEKENYTTVSIKGIDGALLTFMIEVLNSTMDIVSGDNNGVISTCVNGTRVGSFNDLVYNISDIMVPSFIIIPMRYARAQISYVYHTVEVVWCLPNRREIYQWMKVLLPFLNDSTPAIISTIIVLNIVIRLIRKYGNFNEKSDNGTLFKLIGIFFGQQVNINSKYKMITCLFIFWIWFGIILRISYQAILIRGLDKTFLEPPIKTLAEAMEVVDEVGGMPTFIELYRNTSIEEKYNEIKLIEIPKYLKELAAGRRYLFAVDKMQLLYHRQKLQILEERVSSVPACIHMRARWPAAPRISRLIGQFVESGFLLKTWNEKKSKWAKYNRGNETKSVEALDLEGLSSCFYGLIIMYCVCFFVLCVEIILNHYQKGKNN